MSALRPEITPNVVAQCQMAAGEIGQAFTRAFDYSVEATVAGPAALYFERMRDELGGPGLVVVLNVAGTAAAILIPAAGGLLPPWYASPETATQEKLTTLAQELGMLVLPETFMPDEQQAVRVPQFAAALRAGGAADGAGVVKLLLKSEGKQANALVVWPLPNSQDIAKAAADADSDSSQSDNPSSEDAHAGDSWADGGHDENEVGTAGFEADENSQSGNRSAAAQGTAPHGRSLRDLPTYTRSLLKIRVPLSVTLAAKKQPVGQILEIGPGSILQFEKSCEEMLDLNVSNLPIARGEAVKVGEKFGLRVTSLILPGERFKALGPPRQASTVAASPAAAG